MFSMSPVRMHFWQVHTRWLGGSCSPVNQGFMGAMPELISSRDASFWGTREKLGRRVWPLDSKKRRNISRSSLRPYFLGSIGITSS